MLMKGGNKLDQLVQRAQEQAPEIDLADVQQLVSTAGSANPVVKSTLSTLKTLLLMTTITSVIIAVIALWPESIPPEQTQESVSNIQVQESLSTAPLQAKESIAKADATMASTQTEKEHQLKAKPGDPKAPHSNRTEYYYKAADEDTAPDKFQFKEVSSKMATKADKVLENEYFELSKEEWKRLYVDISRKAFEYQYSDAEGKYHDVRVRAHLRSTRSTRSGFEKNASFDEILLPLGLSKPDGSYFTNIRFQGDKLTDSLRKMNKVIVFKTSMRGKSLVWYPISDALHDALPPRVQQACDTRVLQYDAFELRPNSILVGRAGHFPRIDSAMLSQELAYDEAIATFANAEQMEKLGVSVSDTIIKLEGQVKRGNISFKSEGWENFSITTNYDNKLALPLRKKLKFVPVFISGRSVNRYITSFIDHDRVFNRNLHQLFLSSRQGYLPVVYTPASSDSSMVFWYEPTTELLQLFDIGPLEQAVLIQELMQLRRDANLMEKETFETLELQFLEEEGEQMHKTKLLQLDELTLAKLKIFVEDEEVNYISHFGKSVFSKEGMYQELRLSIGPDSTKQLVKVTLPGHSNLRYTKENMTELSPKYITDDLARHWKAAATPSASEGEAAIPFSKMDSFVAHNLRTTYLIPVLVRSGQKYTKLDEMRKKQRPDCIFWFEPNDSFLSVLPASLAASIRSELAYSVKKEDVVLPFAIDIEAEKNVTESEAPSCQFFEVCETQKLAITDHSIYPNPTRDRLNVSITSASDCQGNISIVDIQGRIIAQSEIVLKEQLTTHFNFSLEGIEEGIYIVNLQTSAGDYISQRVVKVQ